MKRIQEQWEAEREALRKAIHFLREEELDFRDEVGWVRPYITGEVVELQVGLGGELQSVCTKRSTLLLCPLGGKPTHRLAVEFVDGDSAEAEPEPEDEETTKSSSRRRSRSSSSSSSSSSSDEE
eukprot:COSAG02_NODE_29688_length_565_cov_0.652361_2_plen_123_part_01